ncbi:hypothetical protein NXW15_23630 [Bacteroides thetaiotaomicron]|jgi:hypothetical protein|uniref:DUF6808 domain-containing protein n=1 Tax=Bacteroides thetaiotaomicron TaxID=818 RepID=UPI001925B019|nr:hypothetical protein [Bacteroides thetaiotaomicron]MBL3919890.1 hypothetical protein [Bacteroides thetaiotaomicron]MBL3943667.1 hypothetical protein [Bacteroides thetaiotaomicron]MBL3948455.1 hypothetical protein [Bacteroides thetaiotaomicron]MBL3958855.1 hypothetical protein [Bacteroides thetaiotaomicron]MCS3185016.1 hypothetical protein [Bacteroides thetaiotaomicron]
MKVLPWILVCLLLGVLVWMRCNPHDPSTVYIKGDTVRIRDTIRDTIPIPVKETLKRTDTVYLPIIVDTTTDRTVESDSIPVLIPITSKEYKTNDYRAVVSGYMPNLDFMEVYREKEIVILKPEKKRWGLGLQTGCSYPGGWYVGIGISYNLVMW